jgi:hypothetical protein
MNIRWYDKITNSEVLQRANLPSIMGMLSSGRLRWLGHVRRMETYRIPKQMLFCELSEGKRHQGRPLLRYKDVCKASMKNFSIGPSTWERLADDRVVWKAKLRKGVESFEKRLMYELNDKREKRKLRSCHSKTFAN